MNRYCWPLILCVPLLAGCGTAARDATVKSSQENTPPPAGPAKNEVLGEYVSFPAVGIKLRQPEGFEKADAFHGFGQPDTASSVMAVSMPGPFSYILMVGVVGRELRDEFLPEFKVMAHSLRRRK